MHDSYDSRISNPYGSENEGSFSELCKERYSRRHFVKTGVALGVAAAIIHLTGCKDSRNVDLPNAPIDDKWRNNSPYRSNFDFIEIEHGIDEMHHVAPDHQAEILLRWGDPIFADAPDFDLANQSAQSQSQQFGYNNDYIGYLALKPKLNEQARALLCVNHEYPIPGLMFPGFGENAEQAITAEQVEIGQAASGVSVVEVVMSNDRWLVDRTSRYNRRITALDSRISMSGPVAGHARLKTAVDPGGKTVMGTFNNCAGGMTPWGTFLTCEENFNNYFSGDLPNNHPENVNHQRYGVPRDFQYWGKHDKRFDVGVEPNEPNRFGWVVEIDPLKPASTPKKRTAMGRFKHEGAENVIAPNGRLVVYMGDDQKFEYLYKFVSDDKVDLNNPEANRDLLDKGTLYVAKFFADGYLKWLPLTHDNGPLQTHFESQADILIEARRAADLLEATPLDRPEDVVPNPQNGKVHVMLTNNNRRLAGDSVNPRSNNLFGHIIEVTEIEGDFAGTKSYWDILVKCGNPENQHHDAQWNPRTSGNGWFASPDNGALDPLGRLWVSTDQAGKVSLSGTSDGLWAMETEGSLRGTGRMFFRVPNGAELCGPVFSDDGRSLFLAVQHPGDLANPGEVRIETAATRWPDFEEAMPPRPSLLVVQRKDGGQVG